MYRSSGLDQRIHGLHYLQSSFLNVGNHVLGGFYIRFSLFSVLGIHMFDRLTEVLHTVTAFLVSWPVSDVAEQQASVNFLEPHSTDGPRVALE